MICDLICRLGEAVKEFTASFLYMKVLSEADINTLIIN